MGQPREGAATATPLEIIVTLMREAWARGDDKLALDYAKNAAPYLHPRAAPAPSAIDPGDMHDTDMRIWMGVSDAPAADAGADCAL